MGKAVSKVVFNGKTLIDLTADSVTADSLLVGHTAHGADGNPIEGACEFDANTKDGTATISEILYGKVAYVNGVRRVGTMPNIGAVSGKIASIDDVFTVPQGYHDGSGRIELEDVEKAKLVSGNIRAGVTILGVVGAMSGTEGAKAQAKTVIPTAVDQTILPDTEQGYNYLSQVIIKAIPYVETDNSAGGLTATIG